MYFLIGAALGEVVRQAAVTLSGAGFGRAAWIGLWSAILMWGFFVLAELLRFLAGRAEHNPSEGPDAPTTRSQKAVLLIVLGVKALFARSWLIALEIAFCLLLAWSPWLLLITIPTSVISARLYGRSFANAFDLISGYALLAVALLLWQG
ncbi:hypothetical protein [Nonomuraea sp. NPDC050786]|uniref:hypothetical protein n=1 Tax=Nonomuraea sp. NPDC050786 TaxID=3154840 RepID=UPI0033DB999E